MTGTLQPHRPDMVLDKIWQRLKPSWTPRHASRGNQSPSFSGPYNTRVLHQTETGKTLPLGDDPSRDTTKLRHSSGPGIQFMSDLHWERFLDKTTQQYSAAEIPRCAPYIILAGDIGRFCDRDALQLALQPLCEKFDKVLLVPGNHEFYGSKREQGLKTAEAMGQGLGDKFTLLNRTRVDLEDVVVLGCTLHSLIPEGAHLTNDFAQIEGWTVADHNAEHHRDLQWLRVSLDEIARSQPGRRIVIVTHYAPAFEEANHPRLRQSPYRHCFSSNTLKQFKKWRGANQVTHWIFGHTHYNTAFTCGDTMVVSNQPNDNDCLRKFDSEATV